MNVHLSKYTIAVIFAVIAALADSSISPLSALLLSSAGPMSTVGFMNLGVGIAAVIVFFCTRNKKYMNNPDCHLRKSDVPNLILMNAADLAGSVFLMIGLTMTSATSASLILNFEIVTAAVIAMIFLHEKISKPLWIAITLITLGCITISAGNPGEFIQSPGILCVLLACVFWAFANNVKKKVAMRNTTEILVVRGFSVGLSGILLMFIFGEKIPAFETIVIMALVGILVYGVANFFFILSQRELSAAKSSTIYGMNPFPAAIMSMIIFHETPTLSFVIGILLLIPGFYMATVTREDQEGEPILYVVEEEKSNDIDTRDSFFDLRNYLTSLGFILLGVFFFIFLAANPIHAEKINAITHVSLSVSYSLWGFLFITGVLLLILRKRNLAGITFITFSLIGFLVTNMSGCRPLLCNIMIFCFIVAGVFFLGKTSKNYLFSLLFFLTGLGFLIGLYVPSVAFFHILTGILIAYSLYLALSSSCLLPKLFGTQILASDEVFSFKRCGTMFGYIVLALGFMSWVFVYIFPDAVTLSLIQNLMPVYSVFLFVISLLMIFIGHVKFTSVVFIAMGFVFWVIPFVSGMAFYGLGIVLLILGLFSICRKKSFMLVALMFFLMGISCFSSVAVSGHVELYLPQVLFNIIPALIAAYLATALFATRVRLPVF